MLSIASVSVEIEAGQVFLSTAQIVGMEAVASGKPD